MNQPFIVAGRADGSAPISVVQLIVTAHPRQTGFNRENGQLAGRAVWVSDMDAKGCPTVHHRFGAVSRPLAVSLR